MGCVGRPLMLLLLYCAPLQAALECRVLELAQGSRPLSERFNHGMLFRVDGAGSRPSHVFGTIHIGDARVLAAAARAVNEPFAQSRRFVMEAVLDTQGIHAFSRLSYYEDHTQLRQVVGTDLYRAAAALLAGRGVPAESLNRMRPWAAYMTLNMPPPSASMPLDLVLMTQAQGQGMSVYGLETVEEQAQTLGQLTLEDQRALLQDAVCHYDALQSELTEMTELYLRRDLGGLMALASRYEDVSGGRYNRLLDNLLSRRNHRMVERMKPHLAAGGAFIAIGALHLASDRGVLARLEDEGYRITVVH